MKRILAAVLLLLCVCPAFAQKESANERTVWKLEHSYWEYVKAANLGRYRSLWHPDFVGWPSVSPTPVRKDHITDWITDAEKKGLRLGSYTLKPAASQATENVVIIHYWLTEHWVDKQGGGKADTIKLTHTWIQTPGGWQIIGGMAAPITMAKE